MNVQHDEHVTGYHLMIVKRIRAAKRDGDTLEQLMRRSPIHREFPGIDLLWHLVSAKPRARSHG